MAKIKYYAVFRRSITMLAYTTAAQKTQNIAHRQRFNTQQTKKSGKKNQLRGNIANRTAERHI